MNTDGEVLVSKHKRKNLQKSKTLQQTSLILNVTFNSPENISDNSISEECATFSADFPALPSQSDSKVPPKQWHFGTSVPFSKIVVKKPEIKYSGIKPEFDQQRSSNRSSFNTKSADHLENDNELDSNENDIERDSKNITSKGEELVCKSARQFASKSSQTVPEVPIISSQESLQKREKKKRKKRPKKPMTVQQGKVVTLTQEQYSAITELNRPKTKTVANDLRINDQNEYPEIGITKEKVPNKKGIATPSRKSDNQANVSPGITSTSSKGDNVMKDVGKKFNTPIEMNILDMLSTTKKNKKFPSLCVKREKVKISGRFGPLNALDSSGPKKKRGKERETPRKPKLSKLKKIILKERAENKLRQDVLLEEKVQPILTESWCEQDKTNLIIENDLPVKLEDIKLDPTDLTVQCDPTVTLDNNQPEPEAFTLESSGICNEIILPDRTIKVEIKTAEEIELRNRMRSAKRLLHCKKFRQYCFQFISEDIDLLTEKLLEELVRFQDRLYLKDPIKAKSKRRLVCGLREVTKNLKLRKLKLVIMAPDIEEIHSQGGLEDALQSILKFSGDYHTPLIFSLPRHKLGRALKKKVPLCCVGIFNYEGAEDIYKTLWELVVEARRAYTETLDKVLQALTPEIVQILSEDYVDHLLVEQMKRSFWGFTSKS